jgi:hypothetical protein
LAAVRHHIVSAFLLERFARDTKRGRLVAMLDKRTGKPTSVSPRDAAVRRHFYSIDVDDGRRDPGIEEVLSKIESIAAPLVRRVEEGEFPVREQRLELAMFVAVCWLRTPAWREQMGSVMEQATTNLVAKSYAVDPEMAQRSFADSDMSREEIEQFREEFIQGLATGRFKVTFPKNLMLRYFLEGAVGAQWTMFLLDWTVVRLPDDYEEFVIADNPFSLFDPTPAFPGGGSGLLSSPNAQGFMPLGPRTGILLEATPEIWDWARENLDALHEMKDAERADAVNDHEGGWAEAIPEREFAQELNLRSYATAERYLFGSQEAVQTVRSQAKANPVRVSTLVPQGPRLHIVEDDNTRPGALRITETLGPRTP